MYLSESLVWMNGIMEPLPLIWLVVWTFWIDATNQWASSIRLGRCWPLVLEKPSLQWFCLSNLMLNKVNSTLLFHYTCSCYSWGFSHPLCFPVEWLKNHNWIAKMIAQLSLQNKFINYLFTNILNLFFFMERKILKLCI